MSAFYLLDGHIKAFRKMLREEAVRQGADPKSVTAFFNDLNKIPPAEESKALICAFSNGCLYGNWPWVLIKF